MKRILAAVLFGLMTLAGAQAQTSIQNLPAAQALSPADLFIVDQLIAPSVRRTGVAPLSAIGATANSALLATPNAWTALQTFTGGAVAPTRSLGDNTTNVATTAFVTAAAINFLATANTWTALQSFTANVAIGSQGAAIPLDVNAFANQASASGAFAGSIVRGVGADGGAAYFSIDTFNGTAAFQGRRANGTAASRTAVTASDTTPLASVQAYGWNGSAYTASVAGSIDIDAAETFTTTSNGTRLRFRTTLSGTGSAVLQNTNMVLYEDGGLILGTNGNGANPVALSSPGAYILDVNRNASPSSVTALPAGGGIRLAGVDAQVPYFVVDSFGVAGGLQFRRTNGTAASKSAVLSGDLIGNDLWFGWTSSGAFSPAAVAMQGMAAENFTNTANGALFRVQTTPVGTTTKVAALWVFASGGVGVGAAVADPGINNIGASGYVVGGTAGASCTLTTVSHLTVVNGIVTLCN